MWAADRLTIDFWTLVYQSSAVVIAST